MLTDIILGQYFPGTSFVHHLDPRTKLLGTIVFIASIFLAEGTAAYVVLTLFAALAIGIGRIPLKMVLRSLRPLSIIIVLTMVIHLFSTPGTVLYHLGPLTITAEGIRQGILMTSRLVFLILMSSLLTFTTSPIMLTDGIERLLNPFRRIGLPAHELAMMMTIALRFIPTLLEETDRIMKAQMARGADFAEGNLLRRAKSMVPLLVPLFISAFRRADELAVAMEARCYQGGANRTRMKELQFAFQDGVACAAILALTALLGVLRWNAILN
ncbi:MAG: energy-coupling factor transporter transmembrane component T [Negativicutes bacterium]|nr:energy-coupling factor transporter transmembrane component T [Negativicutes bacterium]